MRMRVRFICKKVYAQRACVFCIKMIRVFMQFDEVRNDALKLPGIHLFSLIFMTLWNGFV